MKKDRKYRCDIRHKRVRKKVFGTSERPRLNVFRSNKYIYAQLIDDAKGVTIAQASSLNKEFKEQIKSIKGYTIKEKNNVLVVGFNKLELIKLFDSEDGTVLQIADNDNISLVKSILRNCNIIEYIPDKSLLQHILSHRVKNMTPRANILYNILSESYT